jgi:pyroglutamyl-peptidase
MASPKAGGSGTAGFRSLAFSEDRTGGQPTGKPHTVLITGFGPFPGVTRNVSGELAEHLARLARTRHPDIEFAGAVLPVDWTEAPVSLSRLLLKHRPAIALHFGVSARATGFVIETLAHNAAAHLPDEGGRHAPCTRLIAGDRPQRTATLPVRRIVRSLTDAGYPARLSQDPGRYLCNAVMFHSLKCAVRTLPRTRTGFIHIPATLDPGVEGEQSEIGWGDALDGGLRAIEVCIRGILETKRMPAR